MWIWILKELLLDFYFTESLFIFYTSAEVDASKILCSVDFGTDF
jgi:hypothetical protein